MTSQKNEWNQQVEDEEALAAGQTLGVAATASSVYVKTCARAVMTNGVAPDTTPTSKSGTTGPASTNPIFEDVQELHFWRMR